ncbi:MAG: hypothetical protein H2042_15505 [Rhizobiales bacterium]|nr:hypothetical protein [Hyphomicrobiales bacterium]
MNATEKVIYLAVFMGCYAALHVMMTFFAIPNTTWTSLGVALISAFTAYGVKEMRRQRRNGA